MTDITITAAELLTKALSNRALDAAANPLILLSFDECQTLMVTVEDFSDTDKPKPTYLTCLRRALRASMLYNVFSFYLSTTGQVFQNTFSIKHDRSSRRQEGRLPLIPPYSDVGFDQLAQTVRENTLKIEDVAKVEFMVKLGRPLFVHPAIRTSFTI
jgi:hypothetical protein